MSLFVPPRPVPPPVPVKAGPIGPGAGVLMTEFPLATLFNRNDPQSKMRRAFHIGWSVPWIRKAENVIANAILRQPWCLEDGDDVTIDDEYTNVEAQRARALIERPQAALPLGQKLTREQLWRLTFRHTGLCGSSFWFADQPELVAKTPDAILYIRPDRMTPNEDANGNLRSWQLDKNPNSAGLELSLEQVIHFMFEPPDSGHFGVGLVESAILKAQNSTALDQHLAQVLSAGGRLAGIIAPKAGDTLNNDQYQQLVADARAIVEQPDAAKRLQVMRGPVDFVPSTMNLVEMAVREFMTGARDDLLGLWGVPASQLGVHDRGRGLQGGQVVLGDEAVLWQNAAGPRLTGFRETIQYQLLDRWQGLGVTVELEVQEPEFDDEAPKYDLLTKASVAPLTRNERRAIVDREPLPDWDPMTGEPLGIAIDLPVNLVVVGAGPSEEARPQVSTQVAPATDMTSASLAAGETSEGKASIGFHTSLRRLRTEIGERMTPRLRDAISKVLDEQKRDVAAKLRGNAEHIASRPRDAYAYWDGAKWDRRLREALSPTLIGMAEELDSHIRAAINAPARAKAGPVGAVDAVLTRGAARITAINERTRQAVIQFVAQGVARGQSITDLADQLESVTLDNGAPAFDELRAETIARTETGMAYNEAAIGSYTEAGVREVEVIDGDKDEICAAVAGRTFPIDEAPEPLGHPSCTRDFLPVIA